MCTCTHVVLHVYYLLAVNFCLKRTNRISGRNFESAEQPQMNLTFLPLYRHGDIDIVIIRENTEGEYSGLEHEVGASGGRGTQWVCLTKPHPSSGSARCSGESKDDN